VTTHILSALLQAIASPHPPSSGSGFPTSTTLDPSNKASGITLSGGNLTATQVSNDHGAVYSTNSVSSGKVYFEATFEVLNSTSSSTGVGVATSTAPTSDPPGNMNGSGSNDSTSVACVNGSGVFFNNASLGQWTSSAFDTVVTIGIAVDITNKLIWGKNLTAAGNWNNNGSANPATGANGISISGLASSSPLLAVAGFGEFGSNCEITMNFGASGFSGSVPSGFNT